MWLCASVRICVRACPGVACKYICVVIDSSRVREYETIYQYTQAHRYDFNPARDIAVIYLQGAEFSPWNELK